MFLFRQAIVISGAVAVALAVSAPAADRACFVSDGALLLCEESAAKANGAAVTKILATDSVTEFFGFDDAGHPIVALGHAEIREGYAIAKGVTIAALDDSGSVVRTIAEDALRAYPSPSGAVIAVIDRDFRVSVVDGNGSRALAFDRPVTLAAWAPDESALCLTAYPADWSPIAANNPSGPDEFLRLQNSDLFLVSLGDAATRQLTDAPGYDYSGIFDPGGASLIFISSRSGRGAFYSLDLASGTIAQLTNHEPGSYTIPIGRSDSFALDSTSGRLVYEAQETESLSSIRSVKLDGTAPLTIGLGTAPQLLGAGRIAFMDNEGKVKITTASTGKEQGS